MPNSASLASDDARHGASAEARFARTAFILQFLPLVLIDHCDRRDVQRIIGVFPYHFKDIRRAGRDALSTRIALSRVDGNEIIAGPIAVAVLS